MESDREFEKVINGLGTDYPVFLESIGHKVKLHVIEIVTGSSDQTQAILSPEHNLYPGQTYQLRIENLSEYEERAMWKDEELFWKSNRSESVKWFVKNWSSISEPQWIIEPQLVGSEYTLYGCGPDEFVKFLLSDNVAEEVFIETEILDITNGTLSKYYLSYNDSDTLFVGSSMCGGEFNYSKDHEYKIHFRIMRLDGWKQKNWTNWVLFESPVSHLPREK